MKEIFEKRLVENKIGSALRATLFFPNRYYTGMSSLAYQGMYRLINSMPSWSVERYFSDTNSKYTIDNGRLVSDSDIIAISISYELDIKNIIDFLDRFSIPLEPLKRNRFQPLIVIGGALTFINHKIVSIISDITFLGDSDVIFKEFLKDCSENGCERERIWDKYSKHVNIVTPIDNGLQKKERIEHEIYNPWYSSIIAKNTELSNMFLIEISRGCKYDCPFCTVGSNFGKYRCFDRKIIQKRIIESEVDKIGLVSANAADYYELDELLEGLSENISISFSSLRLDTISDKLISSRFFKEQNSITVGLESGSEKLRKIIGKNVDTDRLLRNISIIGKNGKRELRYYIIYGMPGETEQDLRELIELLLESEKAWKYGNITLSLNPFVSVPGTKWQDLDFNMHLLKSKIKTIRKMVKESALKRTTLNFMSLKQARIQHKIINSNPNKIEDILEILK